jgi:hypothetical protein
MDSVITGIMKTGIHKFTSNYGGIFKRVGMTLVVAFVLFGPCFFMALAEKRGEVEGMGNFFATWLGGSLILDFSIAIVGGILVLIISGLKALFIWIATGN